MSEFTVQTVRQSAMLTAAIHDYMEEHRQNLAREMASGARRIPEAHGRRVDDAKELIAASSRYREHLAGYEDWLKDVVALMNQMEASGVWTSSAKSEVAVTDATGGA